MDTHEEAKIDAHPGNNGTYIGHRGVTPKLNGEEYGKEGRQYR